MRQSLLFICLIFGQLFHQSITSCCCCDCCCCCCPCCCCCCGSSNNANDDLTLANALLGLGGSQTTPPADDDFTLGAQTGRQNTAGLGPGLLPDGSTGRTNQQQNNPFNDQLGGRKRRKRGLGILENNNSTKTIECGINCAPILCFGQLLAKRMAIAMPYGSKPKQKPILPSDWTMSIAPENEPSLGPGLLPDGSTGRRPTPMNGDDHHFGDIFGNNGMNWQSRRRKRRSNDENCFVCKCDAQNKAKRESFQLGLVPIDEKQHKNQTYLRLLLGLVPEEGNNNKANNQMKIKRGTEMSGGGGEFTIRRQFFLVPVESKIKNKMEKGGKPAAENVQSVLPKPPLQFYKTVVSNPENDHELYEPDYD